MTPFWLAAAVLTAVVTIALLRPLLWRRHLDSGVDHHDAHSVAVYQDQLADLERERERGTIAAAEADAARSEIGRRLLSAARGLRRGDAADSTPAQGAARRPAWLLATVLMLSLPSGGLALYLALGQPHLPAQPLAARDLPEGQEAPPHDVLQAIASLADRLDREPDDLDGWRLLGQSYARIGRFADSVDAWRRAMAIAEGDPQITGSFAEALVLADQGVISQEARRAFEAVLQADSQDPRARYYIGLARAQVGDLDGARSRWADLVRDSPADAPWLPMVRERLQEVAGRLGLDPAEVIPDPRPADQSGGAAVVGPVPNGSPRGPTAEDMAAAQDMAPEDRLAMIGGMVETLSARLEEQPDDVEGWLRLAHSYAVLGEPDKRLEALRRAVDQAPRNMQVLMSYAVAMLDQTDGELMQGAQRLEFLGLMREVLSLQPNQPDALWFLGLDAANRGRRAEAAEHWQRLLTVLPPDSPAHGQVQESLNALDGSG